MLLLIAATSACSGGFFARRSADASAPVFAAVRTLATWPLLALPILVVPVFAVGTAQLTDTDRGHPADWLVAMLFLLAAIAAWSSRLEGLSRRALAAGGICICASAAAVQHGPEQTTLLGTLIVNDRLAALACLFAALAALGSWTAASPSRLDSSRVLLALVAVALAALAASNPGRFVVYSTSGYAAVFALWSLVHRPAVGWVDARPRLRKAA